jgi:hypothetical protein
MPRSTVSSSWARRMTMASPMCVMRRVDVGTSIGPTVTGRYGARRQEAQDNLQVPPCRPRVVSRIACPVRARTLKSSRPRQTRTTWSGLAPRGYLSEIGLPQDDPSEFNVDAANVITLVHNFIASKLTRHITRRECIVRELNASARPTRPLR